MKEKDKSIEDVIWHLHQEQKYDKAATVAIKGYGPELLSFICTMLHDHDTATELFAQACEELWKSLPRFSGRSLFKTWFFAIGRHTCLHHLKKMKKGRGQRSLSALGTCFALMDHHRSPTLPFLKTEFKDGLRNLRQCLSDEEKTLLALRIDQGLSWDEIAQVMIGPEKHPSAEVIHHRARRYRKRMERITSRLRTLALAQGLFPN
jgi:RNA polymerase sigma-70 factor (ECF subfamily)